MALEFVINLGGNLASALKDSNAKIDDTAKKSKEAADAFGVFEGEVGDLSSSFGGLKINLSALAEGGHFFTFDLAEALRTGVELASQLVEKFVDIGKEIVSIGGKKQDLDLAIKLNVGGDKAQELDELAERFEKETRFDEHDVKSAWLPLLQQGLGRNVDELRDITTAAMDYAARSNTGAEGVQFALEQFGKIALKGQVNFKLLQPFGIAEKDFIEELAKLNGTTSDVIKKKMEKGETDRQQLLSVMEKLIADSQGGALGRNTNESAKTLGATLQRLGNLKENLFEGLAHSEGLKSVQGFLDNFIDVVGGDTGKQVIATLGDGLKAVFGDLSGPQGLEKVRNVVLEVADGTKRFLVDLADAWPQIRDGVASTIEVFGKLFSILGKISNVLGTAIKLAGQFQQWATGGTEEREMTVESQSERDVAAGRVAGFGGAGPLVGDNGEPIPAMADGGIVDGPTLALIGEAGPEMVTPLDEAPRGDGGMTFNFGDIVLPPGTSVDDAHAIGAAVRRELELVLAEVAGARGARAA